jgi:hypothetical protein
MASGADVERADVGQPQGVAAVGPLRAQDAPDEAGRPRQQHGDFRVRHGGDRSGGSTSRRSGCLAAQRARERNERS